MRKAAVRPSSLTRINVFWHSSGDHQEKVKLAETVPMELPFDTLVSYLRQQVGKPYKFFTAGPDTFDCSGLVVAGYRQIGTSLPHQSRMQSTVGAEVDFRNESIRAGDLIFMVS